MNSGTVARTDGSRPTECRCLAVEHRHKTLRAHEVSGGEFVSLTAQIRSRPRGVHPVRFTRRVPAGRRSVAVFVGNFAPITTHDGETQLERRDVLAVVATVRETVRWIFSRGENGLRSFCYETKLSSISSRKYGYSTSILAGCRRHPPVSRRAPTERITASVLRRWRRPTASTRPSPGGSRLPLWPTTSRRSYPNSYCPSGPYSGPALDRVTYRSFHLLIV